MESDKPKARTVILKRLKDSSRERAVSPSDTKKDAVAVFKTARKLARIEAVQRVMSRRRTESELLWSASLTQATRLLESIEEMRADIRDLNETLRGGDE